MVRWIKENRYRRARAVGLALVTAVWLVPLVFGEALGIDSAVMMMSDAPIIHYAFLLVGAVNIYTVLRLLLSKPLKTEQDH